MRGARKVEAHETELRHRLATRRIRVRAGSPSTEVARENPEEASGGFGRERPVGAVEGRDFSGERHGSKVKIHRLFVSRAK